MAMHQAVIITLALILCGAHLAGAARGGKGGDGEVCVSHHITLAGGEAAAETIGRETGDNELTHDNLL